MVRTGAAASRFVAGVTNGDRLADGGSGTVTSVVAAVRFATLPAGLKCARMGGMLLAADQIVEETQVGMGFCAFGPTGSPCSERKRQASVGIFQCKHLLALCRPVMPLT